MAAADRFWVNITGRGGHAAMPHLSIDPVVAASQVCASRRAFYSRLCTPEPGHAQDCTAQRAHTSKTPLRKMSR